MMVTMKRSDISKGFTVLPYHWIVGFTLVCSIVRDGWAKTMNGWHLRVKPWCIWHVAFDDLKAGQVNDLLCLVLTLLCRACWTKGRGYWSSAIYSARLAYNASITIRVYYQTLLMKYLLNKLQKILSTSKEVMPDDRHQSCPKLECPCPSCSTRWRTWMDQWSTG